MLDFADPRYATAAPTMLAGIVAIVVAGIAGYTDLRSGTIRNRLTYPALLLGLSLSAIPDPLAGLPAAFAGIAVAALPLLLGFVLGGVGGGDVKLMAALGALLGPHLALELLVTSLALSLAYIAVVWMARRQMASFLGRARLAVLVLPLGLKPALTELREPGTPLTVPFGVGAALAAAWLVGIRPALPLLGAG